MVLSKYIHLINFKIRMQLYNQLCLLFFELKKSKNTTLLISEIK